MTELSANSCISEGEVATEELWTCSYNNVALDTPCSHPTAELLILQTHLCWQCFSNSSFVLCDTTSTGKVESMHVLHSTNLELVGLRGSNCALV